MNFKIPDYIIDWIMTKLFNYRIRNREEMQSTHQYESFVEECV